MEDRLFKGSDEAYFPVFDKVSETGSKALDEGVQEMSDLLIEDFSDDEGMESKPVNSKSSLVLVRKMQVKAPSPKKMEFDEDEEMEKVEALLDKLSKDKK